MAEIPSFLHDPSLEKCIQPQHQIDPCIIYNHQMNPSMTVTRPTLIPAICLLGLAIPVWLAEAAVPVLLPVARPVPVLRLPL